MCFDTDSHPPVWPMAGAAVDGRPLELTAADGTPIVIAPGRLWMAVFPDNRTVTWE